MVSLVAPALKAPNDVALDPLVLADDLDEVSRIYAHLVQGPAAPGRAWREKPGRTAWSLHEAIAHLCALNGAGFDSIAHRLRGEPYEFVGLETRYRLNAYNRRGIDARRNMPAEALCAEFLRVHHEAARIARLLRPDEAELTIRAPIYNRPIQIVEALGIIVMHAGLIHTAQVAEPAGVPPLWTQLSSEIRHRQITRVMRAFSLLYRHDIGGALNATFAFRVDGPGGGRWWVNVGPKAATSGEGMVRSPRLALRFRATDDFCRMLTQRLNRPAALIKRRVTLHGDLRLFLRMNRLFSADARP